jgi:hypothetical protein
MDTILKHINFANLYLGLSSHCKTKKKDYI